MANYVLVAGARLGSWAWDEVVPRLRAAGHGVYPLTLSGLAEKQGVPAGQQTHVQDIVDEVERQDLRDVVLVCHPIESTFSTVKLRTKVTRGAGSPAAALAMVFKLVESAQTRRRAITGAHLVPLVRIGARFENGILVERQEQAA